MSGVRAARVVGTVAVVAAVAGSWAVLGPLAPGRDVAMPATGASAEDVVQAYLDAIDGHDCATARALWVPERRDDVARWCGAVEDLGEFEVRDESGSPGTPPAAAPGTVEVVVLASYDLDWRAFQDDADPPEGDTVRGYHVVRSGPGDPWRIAEEEARG
ncbi:hypothetical protein [Nocardioides dongxiaopingii]|uniref:hypothetical protein n=1 Tax=Nocardioides dongxiaopingii TaxID=2576036 RepID=UPI0010C77032|nr:hypothetical protein [Nocardioides dongxiaopingii]